MSEKIQVPPPPHVKFTKQGRAYVDADHLIDIELGTTTDNNTAQPAGEGGAPERIWIDGWLLKTSALECFTVYQDTNTQGGPKGIEYRRATPADIAEQARRAALAIAKQFPQVSWTDKPRSADHAGRHHRGGVWW